MIGRGIVASGAIRPTNRRVAKVGVFKVPRVFVASRASTRKMIGRGTMTRGTILATYGRVVEVSVFEVPRVLVAS